jgi:hypothetical protein
VHDRVGPELSGELVGRAGDQVGAALHHDDVVGQALRLGQQVCAHHDRAALEGELADQLEHGVGRLRVQARGRLVEQEQLRLVQDRPGEGQSGLHARRVPTHGVVERVRDAEALRRRLDRRPQVAGHPVQLGGVGQVVVAGQSVVERGLGRHHAAAGPHPVAVAVGVQTEGPHRALGRHERTGDGANAVVLPAPLGPSRTVIRPGGTSKVRSDSARVVANR